MSIDIYTFALVLGIINLIQLIIFAIEYYIHKTYKGPGWWVLWCASAVLGFIFMLTRQIGPIEKISILGQNTMLLLGSIFLYIGIMRFLGKRERLKALIFIFIIYFVILFYFLYIEDSIRIRTILIWLTSALIAFISARDLHLYKTKALELSANICISTFVLHGLFSATKVVILLNGGEILNFASQSFLNLSSYFNLLIVTVFWTFAMIMMINQKLTSEKDKFFSIIAHDLKNPISTFLGLTEIMAEDLPKLSQNETIQIVDKMKESARNLYGLLENLLEWSMMNQGLSRFNPYQFALYPEIFECVMNYSDTAHKKNISVTNNISSHEMVYADQNMLRSLIRNLLSNALKFTPEGGNITISAETTPKRCTIITIRDSGIGMSDIIKNSLFKIGFNTARTGTNGELSSGLGLLLCREFVFKHDGEIWVVSKEGDGSTFYVKLPLLESSGRTL